MPSDGRWRELRDWLHAGGRVDVVCRFRGHPGAGPWNIHGRPRSVHLVVDHRFVLATAIVGRHRDGDEFRD
jgi:hypothetical protein